MRKLLFILMTQITLGAYALPMNVECAGAKMVVNGKDTLFFFDGDIDVTSKIDEVLWYSIETGEALETQPSDAQYRLDDGGYYIVKGGVEYAPFYVFHYTEPDEMSLSALTDCSSTSLTLTGDTKPFVYKRKNGTTGTYARACTIYYNALKWNGEQWADSAAQVEDRQLQADFTLPEALYAATPIRICYDQEIRAHFGMDSACVETEVSEADIKAVNMHLTSLFTARNDSNELERPTDATVIDAGSSATISGPFEVGFYSNPTPAVLFYTWEVYKAANLLVTRYDRDLRYTFVEPGSYRVKCYVNNNECTSEASEVQVNISESYLRVPNVFTPDGNGQNDEFRVAFRSIKKFHCEIYNRWGKKVYEWNDPGKGWDGRINGKPAAEGAYYYVIRALGTDAGTGAKDARGHQIGVYHLSGDINLLRRKK